jgi:membrane fusion protein (multidrug efflux system)
MRTENGKMKKVIIWVVVIAVLAVIVGSRVMKSGEGTAARSIEEIHAAEGVPVDVVTVRTGTITVVREVSGEVSGIRQSTLRSSGAYKIADVVTREGQIARRGQVLVRYDTAISPDRMARLDQVTEAYENAKRQVNRMEPLYEEGAIAESELDAARTQLVIAEADLRNARLELEVVSPIDGKVTLIAVRAGDAVDVGDVVAQVAILDSVRVRAEVSGEAIRDLRAGLQVYVEQLLTGGQATETDGEPDGRITRVSLGANPDTRLFRVEAILDNKDRTLRPGMVVTLSVVIDRVGPVTVMPQEAILGDKSLTRGSNQEVFVVSGDTATRKTVEIGDVAEGVVEVVAGLKEGDMVVVFGANRLKDGVKTKLHRVDGELQAYNSGSDNGGNAQVVGR